MKKVLVNLLSLILIVTSLLPVTANAASSEWVRWKYVNHDYFSNKSETVAELAPIFGNVITRVVNDSKYISSETSEVSSVLLSVNYSKHYTVDYEPKSKDFKVYIMGETDNGLQSLQTISPAYVRNYGNDYLHFYFDNIENAKGYKKILIKVEVSVSNVYFSFGPYNDLIRWGNESFSYHNFVNLIQMQPSSGGGGLTKEQEEALNKAKQAAEDAKKGVGDVKTELGKQKEALDEFQKDINTKVGNVYASLVDNVKELDNKLHAIRSVQSANKFSSAKDGYILLAVEKDEGTYVEFSVDGESKKFIPSDSKGLYRVDLKQKKEGNKIIYEVPFYIDVYGTRNFTAVDVEGKSYLKTVSNSKRIYSKDFFFEMLNID